MSQILRTYLCRKTIGVVEVDSRDTNKRVSIDSAENVISVQIMPINCDTSKGVVRTSLMKQADLYDPIPCLAGTDGTLSWSRKETISGDGEETALGPRLEFKFSNPPLPCQWERTRVYGIAEDPSAKRMIYLAYPIKEGGPIGDSKSDAYPGIAGKTITREPLERGFVPGELVQLEWLLNMGYEGEEDLFNIEAGDSPKLFMDAVNGAYFSTPAMTGGVILEITGGMGTERKIKVSCEGSVITVSPTDFADYQVGDWVFLLKDDGQSGIVDKDYPYNSEIANDPDVKNPDNLRPAPITVNDKNAELTGMETRVYSSFLDSDFEQVFQMTRHKGVIDSINHELRTATVTIEQETYDVGGEDHYSLGGTFENVPIFYHCPGEPITENGHQAFSVGDEVLVTNEWGGSNPGSDRLTIWGFQEGLKSCDTQMSVIVSTQSGSEAFAWDLAANELLVEKKSLQEVLAVVGGGVQAKPTSEVVTSDFGSYGLYGRTANLFYPIQDHSLLQYWYRWGDLEEWQEGVTYLYGEIVFNSNSIFKPTGQSVCYAFRCFDTHLSSEHLEPGQTESKYTTVFGLRDWALKWEELALFEDVKPRDGIYGDSLGDGCIKYIKPTGEDDERGAICYHYRVWMPFRQIYDFIYPSQEISHESCPRMINDNAPDSGNWVEATDRFGERRDYIYALNFFPEETFPVPFSHGRNVFDTWEDGEYFCFTPEDNDFPYVEFGRNYFNRDNIIVEHESFGETQSYNLWRGPTPYLSRLANDTGIAEIGGNGLIFDAVTVCGKASDYYGNWIGEKYKYYFNIYAKQEPELSPLEQAVWDRVCAEQVAAGLDPVVFNPTLQKAAYIHSHDLAINNARPSDCPDGPMCHAPGYEPYDKDIPDQGMTAGHVGTDGSYPFDRALRVGYFAPYEIYNNSGDVVSPYPADSIKDNYDINKGALPARMTEIYVGRFYDEGMSIEDIADSALWGDPGVGWMNSPGHAAAIVSDGWEHPHTCAGLSACVSEDGTYIYIVMVLGYDSKIYTGYGGVNHFDMLEYMEENFEWDEEDRDRVPKIYLT